MSSRSIVRKGIEKGRADVEKARADAMARVDLDAKIASKHRLGEKNALEVLAREASGLDDFEKMGMALAQIGACMIDNARRRPGKVEKDDVNKRVRKALGFTYP
jgi:hypothetical protein